MKILKFSIFILGLFLISCASPMQKKLLSGWEPYYSGEINPITKPVQLAYKPASIKEVTTTVSLRQVGGKNKTTEGRSESYIRILKFEDSLLWEIDDIIKIWTDVYGNVEKIDAPKGEYSDIIKNLIKENFFALPQKLVRSGDVFAKFNPSDLIYKSLINSNMLPPEMSSEINIEIEKIIKGWGNFEGKKVMVVLVNSNDNKLNFSFKGIEFKGRLNISGYQLIDSKTIHDVYSELLVECQMVVTTGSNYLEFDFKDLYLTKSQID